MSQKPIALKEESQVAPKHYKNIAPTSLTSKSQSSKVVPTREPFQKNVPAFLNKLYSMVNDPESDDLICWSEDGASFFVNQQEDFARKVLPRFFKHNKFSSFVRQLNMYGFHKVPHLQQGVLETDGESERWEFSNPHFQRNQPDLLLLVARKKGVATDEKEISSVDLQHILEEIQSIKQHQMNISSQLQGIQRDNQVLWQETMQARERHLRHQETIDKILRFLASVFSSSEKRPAIPRKRRFLLGPAEGNDVESELDNNSFKSNSIEVNEDADIGSERPKKVPRQVSPSASSTPAFNLDDLVNTEKDDLIDLDTANLKSSTRANASDLEDAIALNDQSKHENSTLSSIHDLSNLSNLANIPQLQSLQSLISLAQSNPDLLSQLTSEAFYGSNQSSNNFSDQFHTNSSHTSAPPSSLTYHPAITGSSINSSSGTTVQPQSSKGIDHVTNSIGNISNSADALNNDIDSLGISLQALAQHLGFDPTKTNSTEEANANNYNNEDEDDFIDMDEFLNTFGSDTHPDIQDPDNKTNDISTIADMPSSATTRSPSPTVTTPGSLTSTPNNSSKKQE